MDRLDGSVASVPNLQRGPGAVPSPGVTLTKPVKPIPEFIAEKAQDGHFIDLRLVYPPIIDLLPRAEVPDAELEKLLKKCQPVNNFERWLEAFTAYTALVEIAHPTKTQDLHGYALLIGHAHRMGGRGWLDYDALFR